MIINLSDKRKENELPTNLTKINEKDLINIPIFERIYEIDGELYYEVSGENKPRKLKDYKLEDFNNGKRTREK